MEKNKQSNKERGKIYGIFPVTMVDGVPDLDRCFINDNFMWLFEIMNHIDAIACSLLGIEHYFIIKIDKKHV